MPLRVGASIPLQLIIEARLEGEQTSATGSEATIAAVIERRDGSVADLGLTLAEGAAPRNSSVL